MNKPNVEKTDWFTVKSELEQQPIIKKWIEFNRLSPQYQQGIWEEWNQYYKDCEASPLGQNAKDIRNAIEKKDMHTVKALMQLNKDLKEMGNTVKKPQSFSMDPMEFYHNEQVHMYKQALLEIQKGKKKLNF